VIPDVDGYYGATLSATDCLTIVSLDGFPLNYASEWDCDERDESALRTSHSSRWWPDWEALTGSIPRAIECASETKGGSGVSANYSAIATTAIYHDEIEGPHCCSYAPSTPPF